LFDGRVRAWLIRKAILKFRPEFIHAMETQNGAYPLSRALTHVHKKKLLSPPVLLTLFGSDLYWYSRFPEHRNRILTALRLVDFLALECERDRRLALELGYKGKFLPLRPVARGISPELLLEKNNLEVEQQRKSIAVKGYSGTWGLAHVAIEALALSKVDISAFTVEIFSAERGAIRAAKKYLLPKGIQYKVYKKGTLQHFEVLKLLRRSLIYIGLSRSDGLPSSMLEAMSQGAFPIQTSTACLDGWLENGETGFAVSEPSAALVANLIEGAFNSPELLESARSKNLYLIEEKYLTFPDKTQLGFPYHEVLPAIYRAPR
jgi:glycosyltransferase involved in cell wall biosynthesis